MYGGAAAPLTDCPLGTVVPKNGFPKAHGLYQLFLLRTELGQEIPGLLLGGVAKRLTFLGLPEIIAVDET
jgi:hypothetical protein